MTKKHSVFSFQPSARGITLLELMVAMAIVAMIMAISFPTFTAGLDGVRLQGSARRVGAFLNLARGRADREQLPVEIRIDLDQSQLSAATADGRWERALDLGEGVRIAAVWPPVEVDPKLRRFMVLPGVPAPRFRVQLESGRGRSLTVSVDPLTGSPQIEDSAK